MDENQAIALLMQDMLNRPGGRERIMQGFARKTQLSPLQELMFRQQATAMGHHPESLDDPTYDMRAAWLAGQLNPPTMHGSSQFKGIGDSRLFLPIGPQGQMTDTRTATPGPNGSWVSAPPNPQLMDLNKLISGIMNE
jgi:hypothetical protein